MESYTQEQIDSLPDAFKADYVQQEDGTFKHGASLKLKESLNNLDSKNKSLQSQFDEINEKMNTFESNKAAEIEAAKAKALEEARSKKDVEEIERQYEEKMADLEKRVAERTRGEVEKEYTMKAANSALESDAKLLAKSLARDPELEPAVEAFIKLRMKLDESGRRVYTDGSGSALAIDSIDEFGDEIKKEKAMAPFLKGYVPSKGGLASGGGLGGSATKKPSEMTTAERLEFKQRDPVGFKQAFNL